jgi:hypothetical protein
MPNDRDLKRLARSRMKKTGESYTTARAQLVKKSQQGLAERAGMSDKVLREKTGRTWEEWVRILDMRGAPWSTATSPVIYTRSRAFLAGGHRW